MEDTIKAGVVVVTEFCKSSSKKFKSYIDYINRDEAVRNENINKYNLYQDYMGNPEKTTGLFTSQKNSLSKQEKTDLKNIFKQAQDNESLMWQTVISFDNEWLRKNGLYDKNEEYVDEEKIKEVARKAINKMLDAEGLNNAVWSGAIHFNTDNIHVHVATVEPIPMREKKEYQVWNYEENENGDWTKLNNGRYVHATSKNMKYNNSEQKKFIRVPKLDESGKPITVQEYKGRFKQSSIESCKRSIVNDIINDKENNRKINHIIRDSIIKQKKEHPLSEDREMMIKFEELYNKMPDCNKNMWNYNNPIMSPLKPQVNEISMMYIEKYHMEEFKELQERISIQESIYKESYGNTGNNYSDGKMKDLYTRLGNTILKEIRNYDKEIRDSKDKQGVTNDPLGVITDNIPTDFENYVEPKELKKMVEAEKFLNQESEIESHLEMEIDDFIESEAEFEDKYYKWSKEYKDAKKLIHKINPEYDTAIKILINEHKKGNILATCELGDIYKYGRGKKIQTELADKYYSEALRGFEHQYSKSTNKKTRSYLAYRIGKMYYYGLGADTDYNKAKIMFEAAKENIYAKYMLGKMAYSGQGMEKDYDTAFEYFISASSENAYAAYKAANMIENGEKKTERNHEKLYRSAFLKFKSMEDKQEDDNLEYRIGMMYFSGKGVEKNREKAIFYLEKSAEAKNIYAMNKMAQIYIEENNQEKIPIAMNYLYTAATKGKSSMAMYTLGNVYSSEKYGMRDIEQAVKWYRKAEKNGNKIASYKLGKLYLKNGEVDNAIKHLVLCENKYAWYTLGKIYFDDTIQQFDPQKGFEYMEKAGAEGNTFAQYRLGKEYFSGDLIEQDIDKAIYWFGKAAEQGNEYAFFGLGKIYYTQGAYRKAETEFLKCSDEKIVAFSEYYIGKMYLDKEGEIYDSQKGIEYMNKAAERGNSTAEAAMGFLYLKGNVVKRNVALAKEWLERSAEHGNEFAAQVLENINKGNIKLFGNKYAQKAILNNAARFLKKALKDEWQKRQNIREHEMLTEYEQE